MRIFLIAIICYLIEAYVPDPEFNETSQEIISWMVIIGTLLALGADVRDAFGSSKKNE